MLTSDQETIRLVPFPPERNLNVETTWGKFRSTALRSEQANVNYLMRSNPSTVDQVE